MKKVFLLGLLCAMGFVASGCVAVSSKNNRFASHLDAVAVDNKIYVVNTRTGEYAEVNHHDPKKCVPLERLSDCRDLEDCDDCVRCDRD